MFWKLCYNYSRNTLENVISYTTLLTEEKWEMSGSERYTPLVRVWLLSEFHTERRKDNSAHTLW